MRIDKGITLIALIITIIVMLILAGVALSTLTGEGSIIQNAETAVGEYNNKVINEQETLNEIIEYIKNDGNIDIEESGISISATPDTTGITKSVIVTVVGKAEDGIKSFTSTAGDSKTYEDGRTEIIETCNITENGIYLFTIEDINGKTASTGISIENILEGTIQMQADKTMPTKDNVIVTVTWPSGSEKGVQEIKVGNNNWQVASGNTTRVEVEENCTVVARVSNSTGEVTQASITISIIDKLPPKVTVANGGTETITEGDSKEISSYFNYSANGTAEITSVIYTDTSDGNKVVTNTNTLSVGTHIIKCTVTKETGLSNSATKTIVVEKSGPPVDEDGLATENVTIKPDPDSDLQITIPAGSAPAILATGTLQSGPGEDGSVASIMPANEWNNITTEDINKGIVIVDHAITYTEDVPDFNEFVWVPIPDMSKFKRIEWYNDYTEEVLLTNKAEENSFWEDNTTVEYINMLDSVEYYKGFYIGRYETTGDENGNIQSKRKYEGGGSRYM